MHPLLAVANPADISTLDDELMREEKHEREQDRLYWLPLQKELEAMRRAHRFQKNSTVPNANSPDTARGQILH